MILVIDVGNTRLKWAWLTSTGLSDQQAVVHRDAKPGIWTAALFESVEQGGHEACAGSAERVAERNGSPARVQAVRVRLQFAQPRQRHRCKRLVDLKLIDVIDGEAGFFEYSARGRDRRGQHQQRCNADHRRQP